MDMIHHPGHYNVGGIEAIDVIRAYLGDGFEAFCLGNVIKYVLRAQYKDGADDLKRAAVYLGWATTEQERYEREISDVASAPKYNPDDVAFTRPTAEEIELSDSAPKFKVGDRVITLAEPDGTYGVSPFLHGIVDRISSCGDILVELIDGDSWWYCDYQLTKDSLPVGA